MRRELGEDGGAVSEADELAAALEALPLTDAVRDVCERELSRLAVMPPGSPEFMVSHTYLSTIRDLPWRHDERRTPTLAGARRALGKDHFGLAAAKERILEHLAVMLAGSGARGDVLLLVGPPGVGKSTLARRIAAALDRPFAAVALGGVRDEAEIRGHRRTYVGSMPGKIVAALKQSRSRAPVILLDELDKLGLDHGRAGVASALLEVLDVAQNHAFTDHYLGVPFDLSDVVFVATANDTSGVPAPLLDRMEVVELPSYTELEKLAIARRHLIPKARAELGLPTFELDDASITALIRGYTREAGVRQLDRCVRAVARKLLLREGLRRPERSEGSPIRKRSFASLRMTDVLGPAKYVDEPIEATLTPGVALGLAYTTHGGDILYVESTRAPSADGKGRLTQTGRLGKVMKESTQAAWAYLTSLVHASPELLGVDPEILQTSHVHLHLPSGAVPKDGPSAGLAIVAALASLLTGRALASGLAMTGEITLRGQVLPVGGLKEKLLAAHRYGKRRVVIPAANRPDLAEVPREILRDLEILPVATLAEALRLAGLATPAVARRGATARERAVTRLRGARLYDLR